MLCDKPSSRPVDSTGALPIAKWDEGGEHAYVSYVRARPRPLVEGSVNRLTVQQRSDIECVQPTEQPISMSGRVFVDRSNRGCEFLSLLSLFTQTVLVDGRLEFETAGEPSSKRSTGVIKSSIDNSTTESLQLICPQIGFRNICRYQSLLKDAIYWKKQCCLVISGSPTACEKRTNLFPVEKYSFETIFYNPRKPSQVSDDIVDRLIKDDHKNDLLFKNTRTKVDTAWTKFRAVIQGNPQSGSQCHRMDLLRRDEATGRRGERYVQGKLYDMVEFKAVFNPSSINDYVDFERSRDPNNKGYREANPFDNRRVCEKQVTASLDPNYALVNFYSWVTDFDKVLETTKLRDKNRWQHVHELRAFAARGGVRRVTTKIVSLELYKQLMASRYMDTSIHRDPETQLNQFKMASRGLIANINDNRNISLDHMQFVADNTIQLCMAAWQAAVSINRGDLCLNQ